jgi:hypothetical protein
MVKPLMVPKIGNIKKSEREKGKKRQKDRRAAEIRGEGWC